MTAQNPFTPHCGLHCGKPDWVAGCTLLGCLHKMSHAQALHEAMAEVLTEKVIPVSQTTLPTEREARKAVPMASGLLDYFPAALAEVAKVSKRGNDQHNPGEPIHWARGKSMDNADCILRHLVDRGEFDTDGIRHSAKVAWRALALLQLELEADGAPKARGAKG